MKSNIHSSILANQLHLQLLSAHTYSTVMCTSPRATLCCIKDGTKKPHTTWVISGQISHKGVSAGTCSIVGSKLKTVSQMYCRVFLWETTSDNQQKVTGRSTVAPVLTNSGHMTRHSVPASIFQQFQHPIHLTLSDRTFKHIISKHFLTHPSGILQQLWVTHVTNATL